MNDTKVPLEVVNPVQTSCERCIFADYEQAFVQVGCKLGRITKFLERGTTVKLKRMPDGAIVYLVQRTCMTCRTPEWAVTVPIHEQMKRVREEITLQVHVVVYSADGELEPILKTVAALATQSLKPKVVQIVLNCDKRPGLIVQAMNERYNVFERWFVTSQAKRVLPDSTTAAERQGRSVSIDLSIKDCKAPFYTTFNAGFEPHPEFISRIDHAISDELEQIVALIGDDQGNGDFVIINTHTELGGNEATELVHVAEPERDGPLIEGVVHKASFIANQQGTPHLVRKAEEVTCLTKQ